MISRVALVVAAVCFVPSIGFAFTAFRFRYIFHELGTPLTPFATVLIHPLIASLISLVSVVVFMALLAKEIRLADKRRCLMINCCGIVLAVFAFYVYANSLVFAVLHMASGLDA